MKALSLSQPWADVILEQGKRIENRTAEAQREEISEPAHDEPRIGGDA